MPILDTPVLMVRFSSGRRVCDSDLEYCCLGHRDLVSPLGGHGCAERHVRQGGDDGHCDPSWYIFPHAQLTFFFGTTESWADWFPPGLRGNLLMEVSDQPAFSLVGAVNGTAADRR